MINSQEIRSGLAVQGSNNLVFGVVDHLDGKDTLKLKKDKSGQHHYIPVAWVTKVDDKVHIDRSSDEAMKAWRTAPATQSADRDKGDISMKVEKAPPTALSSSDKADVPPQLPKTGHAMPKAAGTNPSHKGS